MKILSALLLSTVLLLTGCLGSMVPMTKITGSIAGQPFTLQSPKDSELTGLEISAEGKDTFGTTNNVTIKIQSLKASMNPAVITMTADGEAKLISTAAQAGAAIAGQAAAAAAGKP
jgi:hypothetical protein